MGNKAIETFERYIRDKIIAQREALEALDADPSFDWRKYEAFDVASEPEEAECVGGGLFF